jgi:hypothetical protein
MPLTHPHASTPVRPSNEDFERNVRDAMRDSANAIVTRSGPQRSLPRYQSRRASADEPQDSETMVAPQATHMPCVRPP